MKVKDIYTKPIVYKTTKQLLISLTTFSKVIYDESLLYWIDGLKKELENKLRRCNMQVERRKITKKLQRRLDKFINKHGITKASELTGIPRRSLYDIQRGLVKTSKWVDFLEEYV